MTPLLLQSPKRWGWDEGLRGRGGDLLRSSRQQPLGSLSESERQTGQGRLVRRPTSRYPWGCMLLHLQVMPLQMLVQRLVLACASRQGQHLLRTERLCGIFACRCTHGVLEPFGPWPVCGTGYPNPSAQQGMRRGSKQRRTVMTRGRARHKRGSASSRATWMPVCLFGIRGVCLMAWHMPWIVRGGGLLRPGAWKARNAQTVSNKTTKSPIPHRFATERVSKRSRRGDLLMRTNPQPTHRPTLAQDCGGGVAGCQPAKSSPQCGRDCHGARGWQGMMRSGREMWLKATSGFWKP